MNILILTSEFPPRPGGIGNHAWGLMRSLMNTGHEVQVLSNSRDQAFEEIWCAGQGMGKQVHYVPRLRPVFLTYILRIWRARKMVQAIKPVSNSAAILFSGKFSLWLLALLPIPKGTRTMAIVHGSEIKQGKTGSRLTQKALNKADVVVSVSSYTERKLKEYYHLHPKKSRVINNGFLPPRDNPVFKPSKEYTLITVGNISRRKGQMNVVRAFPEMLRTVPECRYEILGIPTEAEALKEAIRQRKLEGKVHIRGAVSEEQKWAFLTKSSVFVMLSEELPNGDFEGFGIAILEANYLGLPAIGSRNSGIADAIEDGYSGFLVDPHNSQEITTALQKILSDYDKFSTQAKQHASKFLWERKVEEYLGLIADGRPQTADC